MSIHHETRKVRQRRITWVDRIFKDLVSINTDGELHPALRPDESLKVVVDRIEDGPSFNWKLFGVAASGFFTDSYNLFASNVILPALAFVYWEADGSANAITINAVTLAGSAVGQIIFGILADMYGRQRLYGVELVIVIFSTVGAAQSATGVHNQSGEGSMSIFGWLLAWRFLMGLGVGAEYPLSACIAAEWSPKRSRGRMMSAIFLMQPLGQVMAYALGLGILAGLNRQVDLQTRSYEDTRYVIDQYWRIITGVGAFVALLAIVFRFSLPETGRWTFGVRRNLEQARDDTLKGLEPLAALFLRDQDQVGLFLAHGDSALPGFDPTEGGVLEHGNIGPPATPNPDVLHRGQAVADNTRLSTFSTLPQNDVNNIRDPGDQFKPHILYAYFIKGGNWRRLAGTSICWFLLDFTFFGLGFNNPATMSRLWASGPRPDDSAIPSWLRNSAVGNASLVCNQTATLNSSDTNGENCYHLISAVLTSNAKESLLTVGIASVAGSLLMIFLADHISRRKVLIKSFLALALGLLITGITFPYLMHKPGHTILIVFFALIQFGFSFGPNTLTFIIPAEIFPTEYRCTCHGISAAAGKLGSVLVQVAYITFDRKQLLRDPNSGAFGWIMLLFSGMMMLGALFAWAWLPDVQEKASFLVGKSLEAMGSGRQELEWYEKVGFRNRLQLIYFQWTGRSLEPASKE